MRTRIEKRRPTGDAAKLTPNPDSHDAPEMTARMHFYAIRSSGDQLRRTDAPRTGKKPDRMVGR
jgi:hypothetical protein